MHFESPTLKKKTEFSIKEKQNFDNRHIEWGLFENKKKDLKKNDNFQDINNKIISHKIDFANISQENSPKKSDHEFSLRKYAEKNFLEIIKRYGDSFFNNIFPNSNILNEAESKILYCNLPIDIENPVNPILLWKKINPGLNSTSIHELFRDQSHQYPNILLFQIEDQKFGGFSSHPWTFFEK